MNCDKALFRLQQAEGTFPCDQSARVWRLFFIFTGWIVVPAGIFWTLAAGELRLNDPTIETGCACALLIGGFVWGYIAWLQKNHRYEIRNGVLSSVGRRVLWRLQLNEVRSIKEYRTGTFMIWWLRGASRTRGLVLYRSLQHLLEINK